MVFHDAVDTACAVAKLNRWAIEHWHLTMLAKVATATEHGRLTGHKEGIPCCFSFDITSC